MPDAQGILQAMAEQHPRVVLTGASGYIGQHLHGLLTRKGYRVVALVREPAEFLKPGMVSHYDLHSPDRLPAKVFDDAVAVIHAALNVNDPSLSERKEIKAAEKLVEQAKQAGVQRLVFISSRAARPDGPNRYARVKWAIEQVFMSAGGTIIRPGLVYGDSASENRGMFALLDKWAKTTPFLPAFLPRLWVQPIHVDDLCYAILNCMEKTDNPVPVSEPAATSISLTAFLRRHAWYRHRRYPAVIPFPFLLVDFAAAAGRAVPLVSAYYIERLRGLRTLRHRPVGEASARAGVILRPLVDGLSASSRRALLEEGRALGHYLNGQFPGYLILSRYVRALEQAGPPAQGHCLNLSPFFLKWPSALRLIDPKYPVCQLAPDLQKEMTKRIQFMAALSESNPRMAPKYHARKSDLLPFVILGLSVRISVDILLRGVGAIVRLGCRLSDMVTSKDSKLANIDS